MAEDEPKARGGRRSKRPKHQVAEVSLRNLRPGWKKGESGNPHGVPKSVQEINRLARELTPGAIMKLNEIMNDPDAPFRDQVAAANSICDRGLGRPAIGIFHGSSGMSAPMEMEDGSPVSALILATRGSPDEKALADLNAEIRRREAKLARDRQEREAHLAERADALARGEEIDGVTALLLHARAINAAAPPPAPKPAPRAKLEAPKPDFIADSAGNVVNECAAPAPSVESTPPTPPKPPPFQAEPDPPPAPKKKAAHPGAHISPGFGEFLNEKATREAEAERARKVEEARAQGRPQIGPAEAFPPDPRPAPEYVNFTRIPGGRGIRRVG